MYCLMKTQMGQQILQIVQPLNKNSKTTMLRESTKLLIRTLIKNTYWIMRILLNFHSVIIRLTNNKQEFIIIRSNNIIRTRIAIEHNKISNTFAKTFSNVAINL